MRDSKVVHYMQIPLNIKPSEAIKTCLIVYSSRESHIAITLDAIETVLESTGKYDIKRLSIHGISGHSQYSQLLNFLDKCSLSIIILDGFRPNVLFEYGILVGLRKPCIVLLEQNATIDIQSFLKVSIKKPPVALIDMDKDFSDVKDQMYVKYNYTEPKKLREILNDELKKVEPQVEEAFIRLVFPEKDYIDKEVKDSIAVFSEINNRSHKLTTEDEVKFRVCVNEIEKTAKKYDFKLTLYYYYKKIQILTTLKKYEEAEKLINTLMIEYSSNTQLLLLKSYILNVQSKNDLAIKCLNDAIKNDDENETLWHQKALLLERLDRKDEAFLCYKKGVEFNDGCANIHYHYGLLLLDNNEPNDALLQFNKALKIRPTDSKYLVCKAISLRLLFKDAAAKKAITDALCFDENNADAWYQFGKMRDDSEALKYFDKCLSFYPAHSGALCSRGAALSNIGRIEEALVDLEKAMAGCREFNEEGCNIVQKNLGKTKYKLYKMGKDEYKNYHIEAIDHFKNALICNDNNKEIQELLNNIGYIYLSLNNTSEARRYLTKAYRIKVPNEIQKTIILYNIALTYLIEENYIKATKLLRTAANLAGKMKPAERTCYCLFIPEVKETNINLVELSTAPDIYECIKVAISITDSVES